MRYTTLDDTAIGEIVGGYLEAALWADARPACDCVPGECACESGGMNGTHAVHEDDRRAIGERIAEWADVNRTDLARFFDAMADRLAGAEWLTWEQAGHDLRLTAEGHGAGFLDRGLGDLGDRLSEASKSFGSFDCWEDDSGVRTDGLPTVRFDV